MRKSVHSWCEGSQSRPPWSSCTLSRGGSPCEEAIDLLDTEGIHDKELPVGQAPVGGAHAGAVLLRLVRGGRGASGASEGGAGGGQGGGGGEMASHVPLHVGQPCQPCRPAAAAQPGGEAASLESLWSSKFQQQAGRIPDFMILTDIGFLMSLYKLFEVKQVFQQRISHICSKS